MQCIQNGKIKLMFRGFEKTGFSLLSNTCHIVPWLIPNQSSILTTNYVWPLHLLRETYTMQQNRASMVEAIDAVISAQAANHSAQCSPITVSEKTYTGKRGRPAVAIDPTALQQLLELRGPEGAGNFLGCSTRTVRRRALDLGLAQPGAPVFTHETQPDGTVSKVYHRREEAHGTDEEVYAAVAMVLDTYPDMGREKMVAAVKVEGVSASRRQVEAAPPCEIQCSSACAPMS
jgi:hypothetical protein